MKTMMILCSLFVVSVTAGEPVELESKRKIYLRELAKIEAERDAKVKDLTKRYLKALEATQVAYTKKGDLDAALAVRKAIKQLVPLADDSNEVPAPKRKVAEFDGVRIDRVVLHQTTNGHFRNAGTAAGVVRCFNGEREMFTEKFKLSWTAGQDSEVAIKVRSTRPITRVRIECEPARDYAGLAEVQVYNRDGENIVGEAKLSSNSSMEKEEHSLSNLVDGKTAAGNQRNWHADKPEQQVWVELTWK